jgi:YidC/Oxa1 family membrane protein insertase
MNFMMIFMGVMFYKVPAGLCVYFIASSLWGMGERKLLPKAKPGAAMPPSSDPPTGRRKKDDPDDDDNGGGSGGGLWSMLLKAAEKETSARRTGDRRK